VRHISTPPLNAFCMRYAVLADHLFLASTPFNVLTAAMVAFELPAGDRARLGLIDQTDATEAFRQALIHWHSSPFSTIELLTRKAGGRGKRRQRLAGFARIRETLTEFPPDQIYTGNDRRLEFQYAMAHSRARGVYLDDGTYSYLGRPLHWLQDRVIDNLVKKLAYGWWWRQPPAIGASSWIDHCIVAFPDSVIPALRQKHCHPLPANLQRPEFRELARLCLGDQPVDLSTLDGLLLLPHSSVLSENQPALGRWLDQCGVDIAYKHHPRTDTTLQTAGRARDLWHLPERARPLPAAAPMEILLPLLPQNCKICGDVSTALLTAKWLRPELNVTAVVRKDTTMEWKALLTVLGIQLNESA